MFPIRDHNPSLGTPFVTWALIAANIAVWLLMLPAFSDDAAMFRLLGDYGAIPARLSAGEGYHTLLTSMFMHGGLLHLAGNMVFLWVFGDNLEEQLGHLGFLAFYIAAGLGAVFGQYIAAPLSPIPMVGASGAIAGVMGGYLLLFPRARVDVLFIFGIFFRILPIPAWVVLGIWFAIQIIAGLAADLQAGGVAYWAHAGGFAVGLLWVIPVWLRRGGPAFWARTHGHPAHPTARYAASSIPRVRRKRDGNHS